MKYIRKNWNDLTPTQQKLFTVIMDRGKVDTNIRSSLIYQIYQDGKIRGFLMPSNFVNPLK